MEAEGQQRIVRAEADVARQHGHQAEILRHAFYIHSQYRARSSVPSSATRPHSPSSSTSPTSTSASPCTASASVSLSCGSSAREALGMEAPPPALGPALRRPHARHLPLLQRCSAMPAGVDGEFVGHPLQRCLCRPSPAKPTPPNTASILPSTGSPCCSEAAGVRLRRISPEMMDAAVRFLTGAEYLVPCASTIDRAALQGDDG